MSDVTIPPRCGPHPSGATYTRAQSLLFRDDSERLNVRITGCCLQDEDMGNISRKRLCSYITVSVLLVSGFFYYILHQLSTPSHRLMMLSTAGTDSGQLSANNYTIYTTSGTVSNNSVSPTSSKAPSLIVCDEECRRFRRLLDAWPADKPKGAVVVLLKVGRTN